MNQKHKTRLYERCVLAGILVLAAAGQTTGAAVAGFSYNATDDILAYQLRGHPLAQPHDPVDEDEPEP